jgi:hypothetical protein
LTKRAVLTYRLPEKQKSTVHEKLFGRRGPGRPGTRRAGILNRYLVRHDHGEIWVRRENLARVKSILRANNIAFTDRPSPRKRSSILRARRRRKAAHASTLREYLRYLKELKAISKGHVDLGLLGAKSEYRSINKSIEKAEEAVEKLRPSPELKEWYLKYCRGKVIAYARGEEPNVEHLKTLVKALRSVIAKGAIDASELAEELFELAASDEITDRRTADRLCRVARQMNLDAVEQLIRWRLERGHLPTNT